MKVFSLVYVEGAENFSHPVNTLAPPFKPIRPLVGVLTNARRRFPNEESLINRRRARGRSRVRNITEELSRTHMERF